MYWVHRSVAEELPISFVEFASKYLNAHEPWPDRLQNFALSGNVILEPDELFKFRLDVIDQTGQFPQYAEWKELPPGKEHRLFEILRRFVKRFGLVVSSNAKTINPNVDSLFGRSIEHIVSIATRKPEEAWKLSLCCIRYLIRLHQMVDEDRIQVNPNFSSSYDFEQQIEKTIELFNQLLIGSGTKLIHDHFPRFQKFSSNASSLNSDLIQRSLVAIWQEVGEERADAAINWLTSAPNLRFAVGSSDQASRYTPAEGID